MASLEAQPLATGAAYIKAVYCFNCQCENFVRTKSLKFVYNKSKLGTFWSREVQTQKITLAITDISFENLLIKEWPDIYMLLQVSWGYNETLKVTSNMQRTVQLLHGMCE